MFGVYYCLKIIYLWKFRFFNRHFQFLYCYHTYLLTGIFGFLMEIFYFFIATTPIYLLSICNSYVEIFHFFIRRWTDEYFWECIRFLVFSRISPIMVKLWKNFKFKFNNENTLNKKKRKNNRLTHKKTSSNRFKSKQPKYAATKRKAKSTKARARPCPPKLASFSHI